MVRVLAGQNCSCSVKSYTNMNVMTAKFDVTYSKLGLNRQNFDSNKNMYFWHQNYMGVVSRLPIASPRHRPMETCHVFDFAFKGTVTSRPYNGMYTGKCRYLFDYLFTCILLLFPYDLIL